MSNPKQIEVKIQTGLKADKDNFRFFISMPSELSNALLAEESAIGQLTQGLVVGGNYEITIIIEAIEN